MLVRREFAIFASVPSVETGTDSFWGYVSKRSDGCSRTAVPEIRATENGLTAE